MDCECLEYYQANSWCRPRPPIAHERKREHENSRADHEPTSIVSKGNRLSVWRLLSTLSALPRLKACEIKKKYSVSVFGLFPAFFPCYSGFWCTESGCLAWVATETCHVEARTKAKEVEGSDDHNLDIYARRAIQRCMIGCAMPLRMQRHLRRVLVIVVAMGVLHVASRSRQSQSFIFRSRPRDSSRMTQYRTH